jgi:hypothetical protein
MTTVILDIPEHLVPAVDEIGDQLSLVLEMGMSRLAPVSTKAYMEAIDFLTQEPTSAMVAAFRFSEEVETRINQLLAKNQNDELSKAEEVELERVSQLEEKLQIVKAKALLNISQRE